MQPPLSSLEIVHPDCFAGHGYPHEAWRRLRLEAPVFWCEGFTPLSFWAITRHREIAQVSCQPQLFASGPRTEIVAAADAPQVHGLITMDPPEHGRFRQLVIERFMPRALGALRAPVEEVAREVLDALEARAAEGECDFVRAVAEPFPVAVVAWMLGVPNEDRGLVRRWTNEVVGALDPEFHRGEESAQATQARPDGGPVPDAEIIAFAVLLMIAGNETTRNATSGGLVAFLEHPDEWQRLRADPVLLPAAMEEVLRWTSPVVHFARTATEDAVLCGQKIRAGDALGLFYASANRDDEVHHEPFAFRIDRSPNRHLAFGVGERVCLGAHVARLELRAIFAELLRRLESCELAGPVVRLRSATTGGLKSVPVRYRLRRG